MISNMPHLQYVKTHTVKCFYMKAFPHLFPYGVGKPPEDYDCKTEWNNSESPHYRNYISTKAYDRHMLLKRRQYFATDFPWLFARYC